MYHRISQIRDKLSQDKIKQKKKIQILLDQTTRKLIQDYSPMWTNKQIWEFEQLNEELTFDTVYAERSDFESWNKNAANYHESTVDRLYKTHSATKNEDRTDGLLVEKGEFSKWDLYIQMFDYLNLSIDNALNHSSPVINAIAVADKRTGKRRLAKLHFDHPLPMKILNERLKREDTNNRQHRI